MPNTEKIERVAELKERIQDRLPCSSPTTVA